VRTLKLIGCTAGISVLAIVALIVLVIFSNLLIAAISFPLSRILGIEYRIVHEVIWWISFAVVMFNSYLPKRWMTLPGVRIFSTQITIDAPLETVWEACLPRARDDYFQPGCKKVTDEGDGVFHFHHDITARKKPYPTPSWIKKLTEVQPMRSFKLSLENADKVSARSGEFVYSCEEVDSQTVVRVVEQLTDVDIRFWLPAKLFSMFGPHSLKPLKDFCEGKPDRSWVSRLAKIGGHVKWSGSDQDNNTLVTYDEVVIMATLTLVMGGLVAGLVAMVVSHGPPAA